MSQKAHPSRVVGAVACGVEGLQGIGQHAVDGGLPPARRPHQHHAVADQHGVIQLNHLVGEKGLLETFKNNNALLDQIQQCLEAYLESKRVIFPRFYFLSNDELLEILAQTRNPQAVQPHLRKCFDSVARLEFALAPADVSPPGPQMEGGGGGGGGGGGAEPPERVYSNDILAMVSPEGEKDLSTCWNILDSAASSLWMSGAEKMLSRYSQLLWHDEDILGVATSRRSSTVRLRGSSVRLASTTLSRASQWRGFRHGLWRSIRPTLSLMASTLPLSLGTALLGGRPFSSWLTLLLYLLTCALSCSGSS
ncbi:hypothetical protein CRUP_027697 [Coryphaenoides rupestris]|nr:hypothetical protein CRUP_027697 [Coryphaenoides rupestris]